MTYIEAIELAITFNNENSDFILANEKSLLLKMKKDKPSKAVITIIDNFLSNDFDTENSGYVINMVEDSYFWAEVRTKQSIIAFIKHWLRVVTEEIEKEANVMERVEVSKEILICQEYCTTKQVSDAKNLLAAFNQGLEFESILNMPLDY